MHNPEMRMRIEMPQRNAEPIVIFAQTREEPFVLTFHLDTKRHGYITAVQRLVEAAGHADAYRLDADGDHGPRATEGALGPERSQPVNVRPRLPAARDVADHRDVQPIERLNSVSHGPLIE